MSKTIVIIDDDSDDLDIMKEALNQIDPSILCICFVYPEEAVRLLGKELVLLPDYIFVDVNMPKITGVECLYELRKIPEFMATPIIVYSTSMSEKVSDDILDMGATYTLQKPYSINDYVTALECIILGVGTPSNFLRAKGENSIRQKSSQNMS
jgi:CheY-like chemotaxis protein